MPSSDATMPAAADATPTPLKVFISSPSDVRSERQIARRVVERLAREFAWHFTLETVFWEDVPMLASGHFQDHILPPSRTDIVVVILWSRLGVPLPDDERFRGRKSQERVTGTEWEFEDALAACEQQGKPEMLLYQKTAAVMAMLDDQAALTEGLEQRRKVKAFMTRWFVKAQPDGRPPEFLRAYNTFAGVTEFEEELERHLRGLLRAKLPSSGDGRARIEWHQGNPYRALESFRVEDADVFFGRTRETQELREILVRREQAGCAFLLAFGASGSGKSSMVKAGLLKDLQDAPGLVPGVKLFRHAIFKPADGAVDWSDSLAAALLQPCALPELALTASRQELAAKLATLDAPTAVDTLLRPALGLAAQACEPTAGDFAAVRLVLVVDQFEELFTAWGEPGHDRPHPPGAPPISPRAAFVRLLAALSRSGRVWVVATMRSDFFQRLAEEPLLIELSQGEGRYAVLPPDAAARVRIIEQPALRAGLVFEQRDGVSLADVLNADAATPDALPLLEFTLDRLWQTRRDGVLTYAAYEALGGLRGALGQHAHQVYESLPSDELGAFAGVIRRLAHLDPNDRTRFTARAVAWSAPDFPEGSAQDRLVSRLVGARLLVSEERSGAPGRMRSVRVAHEALLTHWVDARRELEAGRPDLETREWLGGEARAWQERREASCLLRPGLPLARAEDWLQRNDDVVLQVFVDASRQAADAAARRGRRRLLALTTVFAVLAVTAATAAMLARQQQQLAEEKAALARSRGLSIAVAAHLTTDPELATLLALEAMAASPTPRAQHALRSALLQVPQRLLSGHRAAVNAVACGTDGAWLAAAGDDGTLRLWDASTGQALRTLSQVEADARPLVRLAVAAPARLLAAVDDRGGLSLWDAALTRPLRSWPAGTAGHAGRAVTALAVTADATVVATADADGRVVLWQGSTGTRLREWVVSSHAMRALAFTSDGSTLLAAGNGLTRWRVADGTPLGPALDTSPMVSSMAISQDDRFVAIAVQGVGIASDTGSNTVKVLTLGASGGAPTGNTAPPPPSWTAADGGVDGLAFHPDGRTLAVGSHAGRIRLWSWQDPAPLKEHIVMSLPQRSLCFSPDGRWLASAWGRPSGTTTDRRQDMPQEGSRWVRQWSLHALPLVHRLEPFDGGVASVAFSADGASMVTGDSAGALRVWETTTGRMRQRIDTGPGELSAVQFSPDGSAAVGAGQRSGVRLWRLADEVATRSLPGHEAPVYQAVFSPDGTWVATVGQDLPLRVFRTADGALLHTVLNGGVDLLSLAVSPDGRHLAVGAKDGAVSVWQVGDAALLRRLGAHAGAVYGVAFGPGGMLASAGLDRSVRVWQADSGEPRAVLAHPADVSTVDISRDGLALVSGGPDGRSWLWDLPAASMLAQLTPPDGAMVRSVAFGATAAVVAVAREDRRVSVWRCDVCLPPEQMVRRARERVLRALTPEERNLHLGD